MKYNLELFAKIIGSNVQFATAFLIDYCCR